MIDFRLKTFLILCETKNYTKAANILHITQPAVSQHIKYLEKEYNAKLFNYSSKLLTLTKKGELLKKFALGMLSNSNRLAEILKDDNLDNHSIKFGATLTIGEYVMPKVLKSYLKDYPKNNISMYVDNTTSLLNKLNNGEIDFALIEGNFTKSDYSYKLISKEKFIPICSKSSPFSIGSYSFDDLCNNRLVIRENGSGTRNVLEGILHDHGLSIFDFNSIIEISNFSAIKSLVSDNIGISFVYEAVVKQDIMNGSLSIININDFSITHEFNFVYLKNSIFENYYLGFFDYFYNKR